jgi:hypothetical protein
MLPKTSFWHQTAICKANWHGASEVPHFKMARSDARAAKLEMPFII